MTRVREAFANGSWRNWLLGVVATLVATLVVNGISFQRDTKEKLSTNEERIKFIETRSRDTLVREFERQDKQLNEAIQRFDRHLGLIERRLEALEKR